MMARWTKGLMAGAAMLLLAACGQKSTPEKEPFYGVKVGKPYSVNGESYTPQYQPFYEEEGMASWYGPGFHGSKTSYGEVYNSGDMTAAHRTLPLPSMVEVTNLNNGKSTIVRVNDRGPFSKGRIIDVSKAAAEKLGMIGTGTAKVSVRYLKDETEQYILARGGSLSAFQTASANSTPAQMYQRAEEMAAEAPAAPIYTVSSNSLSSLGVKEANASDDLSAYKPAAGATSRDLPPLTTTTPNAQVDGTLETANLTVPTVLPASSPIGKPRGSIVGMRPTQGSTFIQVGAFGIEENARKTANQMAMYGNATTQPYSANGRSVYRVRLGPLSESDAQKSLEQVMAAGFKDAKIVRN